MTRPPLEILYPIGIDPEFLAERHLVAPDPFRMANVVLARKGVICGVMMLGLRLDLGLEHTFDAKTSSIWARGDQDAMQTVGCGSMHGVNTQM